MQTPLPKRKALRLKQYNYSAKGAYFITICTVDKKQILANVVKPSVGVGAHDDPQVQLTPIGKIVEKNLLSSNNISGVKIDQYVIMPDHLHAIVFLDPVKYAKTKDGSSRAPTPTNRMLPRVISAFKRFSNKEIGKNIFQRGYMEHIIRDQTDYETRVKYVYENPARWYYNKIKTK